MALVASGRERRRREIVAALFALLGGDKANAATDRSALSDRTTADMLVARLFREEGTALVRLARLFTDDRNAAEDLVQEAFIRLHRSANRIKDIEKAAPYLRSIVLNLARDHNRRGLMSLRHLNAMKSEDDAVPFEDVVVATADQQQVLDSLRELAPRQRDCLVLRFFYELTEKEIAATLGISPNSVKTHCRRGIATLSDKLGAQS